MSKLKNKKIAILATDGFEESELFSPKEALEKEGATTEVISLEDGEIVATKGMDKGRKIAVDRKIVDADINHYDGVLIPGGLYNPDALRQDQRILSFVRGAFAKALPVAAICHGPQVLITADVVKDRTMTGFAAIQKDLENAGAHFKDQAVVVDSGLVTSRNPGDLDAFNAKIIEEFCEGKHSEQRESIAA